MHPKCTHPLCPIATPLCNKVIQLVQQPRNITTVPRFRITSSAVWQSVIWFCELLRVIFRPSLRNTQTIYKIRSAALCRKKQQNSSVDKNQKSKHYCKADQTNVYCFFLTIFRLATPAFFRFTDVPEFMIGITILYRLDGECRFKNWGALATTTATANRTSKKQQVYYAK